MRKENWWIDEQNVMPKCKGNCVVQVVFCTPRVPFSPFSLVEPTFCDAKSVANMPLYIPFPVICKICNLYITKTGATSGSSKQNCRFPCRLRGIREVYSSSLRSISDDRRCGHTFLGLCGFATERGDTWMAIKIYFLSKWKLERKKKSLDKMFGGERSITTHNFEVHVSAK